MPRRTRLLLGTELAMFIGAASNFLGCAALSQEAQSVTPDQAVQFSTTSLATSCMLCDGGKCKDQSVLYICSHFTKLVTPAPEPDDAPRSGDSGPSVGPGEGQGVHSLGGAPGR